jgi:2-oxo-4-hydroxy-4-carboxy--5-ureidoimidazoline (OHCU) decarboxylase
MTELARITGALEQAYAAIEKLCAVMSAVLDAGRTLQLRLLHDHPRLRLLGARA